MKHKTLIRISGLVLCCVLAPHLFSMTINGELSSVGDRGTTNTVSFKAALSTNLQLWQITVLYPNRQDVCGSDGEKTCCISKWSKEALQATRVPQAIPQASIVNGVFPGVADTEDKILWFAFASSSFFTGQTNPLACLWNGGVGVDTPGAYTAKIENLEFLNYVERLPIKADFMYSTEQVQNMTNFTFVSYRLQKQSDIEQFMKDNRKYDDNLVGEYTVVNFTNFNGTLLPLEFYLKLFSIPRPHIEPVTRSIFHGKVNYITDESPDSFLPIVKESLYTTDFRFSDRRAMVDYIKYKIENQNWPSTNDLALQTLFASKINELPPLATNRPNSNRATILIARIILLLTITALPICLYWHLKKTNSTKER
jgi:hypothetical protein